MICEADFNPRSRQNNYSAEFHTILYRGLSDYSRGVVEALAEFRPGSLGVGTSWVPPNFQNFLFFSSSEY